jgi:hypothetical protein
MLEVSATIFNQRPPIAHNKVTAALNQLCQYSLGAILLNQICSRHLQTTLKLSTPIATRYGLGLLDLLLICNLQALICYLQAVIYKIHHLNFTKCPPELPENCLRRSKPDLTLFL